MMSLTVQGSAAIPAAENKSFMAIVDSWLEYLAGEKHKKARTIQSYRYSLVIFKGWLDTQGITQPRREDVKAWCKWMDAATNKSGKPWTPATKNLYLSSVKNFYKWLESEYGIANIAAGLDGWKNSKEHKHDVLSCGEMRKLIESVDTSTLAGKRDKAIIGVMMTAGLRTIEISRLRICDLIRSGGVFYLDVLGKGQDDRVRVKISRKTEGLIRDWLTARETVDVVDDSRPLFCSLAMNSFGETITSVAVSRICKKYLEASKLKTPKVVAHSLRASMATNAFLKGARLDQVQQQLRHVNLATTQIYLREAEKALNPCTDLISEAIF